MRFDVYEVACASTPPHFKPSRAQAALADAALWQTAEFVAARDAGRSAKQVWTELRGFTGLDEISGPGTEPWPNDSLLFAVDDSRALRVYAVEEPSCRFCGRPHRNVPGDLCPAAREEYDRVGAMGARSRPDHIRFPHDASAPIEGLELDRTRVTAIVV